MRNELIEEFKRMTKSAAIFLVIIAVIYLMF